MDHLNPDLRSHLKDWLMHLKEDVGYEGWRFDFVKGYGPEFVKEYVLETVGGETFNVGEYWVDLRCAACCTCHTVILFFCLKALSWNIAGPWDYLCDDVICPLNLGN